MLKLDLACEKRRDRQKVRQEDKGQEKRNIQMEMDACTQSQCNGRMDSWTHGRIDAWTHGRMYAFSAEASSIWDFSDFWDFMDFCQVNLSRVLACLGLCSLRLASLVLLHATMLSCASCMPQCLLHFFMPIRTRA